MTNPMHLLHDATRHQHPAKRRHQPKRTRWLLFLCAVLAAVTFASPVMGGKPAPLAASIADKTACELCV